MQVVSTANCKVGIMVILEIIILHSIYCHHDSKRLLPKKMSPSTSSACVSEWVLGFVHCSLLHVTPPINIILCQSTKVVVNDIIHSIVIKGRCQWHYTQYCQQRSLPTISYTVFSILGSIALSDSFFGNGTGRILLEEIACLGSESRLIDCTFNNVGVPECSNFLTARVRCSTSST